MSSLLKSAVASQRSARGHDPCGLLEFGPAFKLKTPVVLENTSECSFLFDLHDKNLLHIAVYSIV